MGRYGARVEPRSSKYWSSEGEELPMLSARGLKEGGSPYPLARTFCLIGCVAYNICLIVWLYESYSDWSLVLSHGLFLPFLPRRSVEVRHM